MDRDLAGNMDTFLCKLCFRVSRGRSELAASKVSETAVENAEILAISSSRTCIIEVWDSNSKTSHRCKDFEAPSFPSTSCMIHWYIGYINKDLDWWLGPLVLWAWAVCRHNNLWLTEYNPIISKYSLHHWERRVNSWLKCFDCAKQIVDGRIESRKVIILNYSPANHLRSIQGRPLHSWSPYNHHISWYSRMLLLRWR